MTQRKFFGVSLFALVLAMPAGALAQDVAAQNGADANAGGIAEIIVTAQKRVENVQDVPIAISAFGGAALAERQIGDVAAIGNITPNVNLDAGTPFAGSTAVLGAFIRGIGQNDFAVNVDPGVGVYLDGIYLARTIGANFDLPDVERVEILKGPQGTLFGRNTIGGAISVVTRDPRKDFGVEGTITTGRFNRLDASAIVDVPLSDTLLSSVTFSVKNRDGYARRLAYNSATPFVTDDYNAFREVAYSTSEREGGESLRSGRLKLKWDASPAVTVRLSGDYTRTSESALPTAVLGVRAAPGSLAGLYNLCISTPSSVIGVIGLGAVCGEGGTSYNPERQQPLAGVNVDADPSNNRLPFDDRWVTTDPDKNFATGNSFSRLTNWGLNATIDWDIADSLSLRSITGYRDVAFSAGIDADNSPMTILHISNAVEQQQFSQELQLIGNALDKTLNYVLGAYYFRETASEVGYANIASSAGLQVEGPVDVETENYAVFGQVDWRPADIIGITIGGRYTHENKQFEAGQTDINGFTYKISGCLPIDNICRTILGFPDPGNPLRFYPPEVQRKSFSNFSPKVGVQLYPTDDVMAYASYGVGYKTGGWSTRLAAPFAVAPDFDEEEAKTWEAGIKATLLDRRLQANLAVFTTDYSGIQMLFQRGASPITENAGRGRIKGFELEVVVAPTSFLRINASVGHLDARFTEVLAPALSASNPDQAGLSAGSPLSKVPRWKFNVTPRIELPLANGASVTALVDYSRISSVWNDTQRTYLLRRPAIDVLAANITYRAPEGQWSLSVGGTNLVNQRYVVNGVAQLAGGLIYGSYNRPREWYAKFGFKF